MRPFSLHTRLRVTSRFALLLLALSGPALSACDDAVDPFIESDRLYSVYGSLDMNADTQYVRVIKIDTSVVVAEHGSIDAAVSTLDLDTGQRTTWTDSIFTFTDGSRGHVFYAPLRIVPEHTYRLEVVRSDGQASTAETTVPPVPSAEIGEPRRLFLSSGGVEVTQNVVWSGFDRKPGKVEMWYRFSGSPRSAFTDIRFEYPTADQAPGDAGWTVVAQLSDDRDRILETLRPQDYLFLGVGMRLVLFDDKFVPPGGVFDPEILSQPGTFSNVENGFGFVGSVGRFDVEWVLDAETTTALGFVQPKTLD